MKIALTYDLRSAYLAMGYSELETAEFDQDSTIDALEQALAELGHTIERVGHGRQLAAALVAGTRWDLVFNICEGLRGFSRESQVPALLDLFEIPYTFSSPLVTDICLHKQLCKRVLRDAGVTVGRDWLVEREAGEVVAFAPTYPAFVKPVAEGTGKGIHAQSIVHNIDELHAQTRALLQTFAQPVLIEDYLPGREFTVGIVGSQDEARVLGTLEIVLNEGAEPGVHSYINKERCEELVEYRYVPATRDTEVAQAEASALQAWKALGCRDAGRIDLRSDAHGVPHVLEVNPLAGLHPSHSDLPMLATAIGMPYRELIGHIVRSAEQRTCRVNG